MHNNDIFKTQYNSSSCNDARLLSYGQMTFPTFKARLPKTAEKQITDEALKIASAAIAASGIVYLISSRTSLTQEQQEAIIEKYKQGTSYRNLAGEYGCSVSFIHDLVNAQNNKEELKETNKAARKKLSQGEETEGIVYVGYGKSNCALTRKQQKEIIEKYKQGSSYGKLAVKYSCSVSAIQNLINAQDNKEELKEMNKAARKKLSSEQEAEIIEKYKQGMTYEKIAEGYKEYGVYRNLISGIIHKLPNAEELIAMHEKNMQFFTPEQKKDIIEKYKQGGTYQTLAIEYNCATDRIQDVIQEQENSEELKKQSKECRLKISPELGQIMLQRYINGEAIATIVKNICSEPLFRTYIDAQPNADEINQQHEGNKGFFRPEVKKQIVERFVNGESCKTIAKDLSCSDSTVYNFIKSLDNAEELISQNKANYQQFTPEEQEKIITGFSGGMSYRLVAKSIERGRGVVRRYILSLPNIDELLVLHAANMKKDNTKIDFSEDEIEEIINRFLNGETYLSIANEFDCSDTTVARIVKSQLNDDVIKNTISQRKARERYTPEQISYIIENFKKGDSIPSIARDKKVNKAISTIRRIINAQENAEELFLLHRQNASLNTLRGKQDVIIKSYRAGKSYREIARDFDCISASIGNIISRQPDLEDIKSEHNKNIALFNENQLQDIFQRKLNGETIEKIAQVYKCSATTIWRIFNLELNKNRHGTTKETFWNKYEQYSIDELKTRISEQVSLKQVEENDELLEIMFFLDEKAKFGEDEKALSIDFIRLLDKIEQQKASTKNVIESQTVKDLFDLMDKDLIKQQVFEELNKDYNAAIDELNLTGNEALGDICSKYIAHNIDDEDNIASMKTILNIISSNDEKAIRHKLVAFDNMKQNPNDERIKEAEEIYGEDNQEKIGQYIIFDQVLKGEYTNADFDNDVLKFVDELKDMHLNKDAIIKRLIELEDYFNSKEAENNSLTNFVKHFNSNDNYINKLLTDFYIDNIYKDKVTTIEVTADSKYFSGENITLMIYPEAKQATLSNTEVNFDKHLFLIDSEEYAKYFASRKLGSLGIKIFTLDKSYQKEGFYSGENVLEIKVPNGYNGARLAAKIKNEDNRVFEIKYFMPKGFHKEKKRTDL